MIGLPAGLTGPFYVFVITDPRGEVFELGRDGNNSNCSPQPMLLELPAPTDLQVTSITVPSAGQVGRRGSARLDRHQREYGLAGPGQLDRFRLRIDR